MKNVPFNLDSLDLNDILTADELTSIDAGSTLSNLGNAIASIPGNVPGYVNGMQNWMQIP